MSFVYRVAWVLKALWLIFWENCIIPKFSGCPQNFYYRVMYRAPSSGHELLNLNLPFKFILSRFEVVFWCLEWECCTSWKIDRNSFKSTNTVKARSTWCAWATSHVSGSVCSCTSSLAIYMHTKLTHIDKRNMVLHKMMGQPNV